MGAKSTSNDMVEGPNAGIGACYSTEGGRQAGVARLTNGSGIAPTACGGMPSWRFAAPGEKQSGFYLTKEDPSSFFETFEAS